MSEECAVKSGLPKKKGKRAKDDNLQKKMQLELFHFKIKSAKDFDENAGKSLTATEREKTSSQHTRD